MTSGIYGFYKNGIYKVAYNNCMSDPEYFGKNMVAFIKENSIEELNEIFYKIKLVNYKEYPNNKELQELKEKFLYCNKEETWDEISCNNSGFLNYYVQDVYFMTDYSKWIFIQCYTYIINLSSNLFIVYEKDKKIADFPLNNIPKNWFVGLE
jgi:hypothetical protein